MIPSVVYQLGHIRLTEMHRQAQRDALVRALRQMRGSASATSGRPTALARWAYRLGRVSAP
jgi:hypothetical protein